MENRCENEKRERVVRNRGSVNRCFNPSKGEVSRQSGERMRVCGRCRRSVVNGRQRSPNNPWS